MSPSDLLARTPDEGAGARGVHVDLERRRVRLESGSGVDYRIEVLAGGNLRLGATAGGPGTLTVDLAGIERATGARTPGAEWTLAPGTKEKLERDLPLPAEKGLVELRIAWRATDGRSELELGKLALQESAPVERPSILLIVIDTLSARHLSLYGYSLETDPELTRLAAESFLFERCLANAPWTVPSFMSLMTGLYAYAHQLLPPGNELWETWYLAQSRWTLAECLRAAGYRTAGFVDSLWVTEKFGFTQGFDVFDASAAYNSFDAHDDPNGGIRATTAQARDFLDDLAADTPFFLFVHGFDVHSPYTVKPESEARGTEPYDLERTAPAGGSSWAYGIIPTSVARAAVRGGELPSPMHTAPIERAYDEGVRFVDEELGKFFAHLRASGVLDRCWLIVTADHGETMSDSSHLYGHGLLVQDVMHVPLLVRPPGGLPGGRRIPDTTQLADLYPTLIELAGIEPRDAALHGSSLVPLLRGRERAAPAVLAEGGMSRQAMLVADGWKLVEFEPALDGMVDSLLTHPRATRAWFTELEAAVRKHFSARPGAAPRARGEERPVRDLVAWTEDVELQRDLFERMPATGLTEELFTLMRSRNGFRSLAAFVQRGLRGPFYELYDLDDDPRAVRNVAAERADKLEELKALLAHEKQRRSMAWQDARSPAAGAAELTHAEIQALEALGYGGSNDD